MKKPSDNKLKRLWSRAVIAKYKYCPITGERDNLQAHHIVPKGRQNRFALRWDIRNGVPLHPTAHRKIHDGDLVTQRKLLEYIDARGDTEYLMRMKSVLKHEFLNRHMQMTEDEYRQSTSKILEGIINDVQRID